MALLFMDGFDAGDYASKWSSYATTPAASSTTRWGTGRSITLTTSGGSLQKLITPASQIYVGFAYCYQISQSTTAGAYAVSLYGDNNATQHLVVSFGTQGVVLYRGSTQLASNNSVVEPANLQWIYVEVSATINDTTGTCVVRVNGTEVINFTGDTRNSGTSTNIDAIRLLRVAGTTYYDDLYICDGTGTTNNTFLGDVRVQTLTPNGAGSSTQFTPTGVANNWDNVDELPFSTTDYNSSSTTGQRDLYALTDLVAGTSSVKAIQNNLIARKTDAGTRALKTAVKSGGTVYTGSAVNLSASDLTVSTIREVDPATSAAWTVSGVNALEAGAEVG